MLTYLNLNKTGQVFTREELLKDLDKVIDGTKNKIGPSQLSSLQKVREAIVQIYGRIDTLNQTIANMQKVNKFYSEKIASYPAEQAQRINQSQEKEAKIDPAAEALQKIEESMQ